MRYEVKDGKIQSKKCELNIAHHCNLSCRSCSHLSPVMKKYYMPADVVYSDLSVLAKYYQAEYVRILGGEPTLHPNIEDVMQAARSSGISKKICVVTNGTLLWRMTDRFWELVDELDISVYPGVTVKPEQRQICEQKINQYSVRVSLNHYEHFQEAYSEIGANDYKLVRRIYNTCQIAHQWQCNNVQEGYFYKCPQSLFLPMKIGGSKLQSEGNGIKIEDTDEFGQKLHSYLESQDPLPACGYCLGSVGKHFKHEQINRKQWSEYQQQCTEDLTDFEYLELLEHLEHVDPVLANWNLGAITRSIGKIQEAAGGSSNKKQRQDP